ncbi:hypothetical protein RSOLAG1IB_02022 [Rhizoctonia solani AG-1 IB]|uniref:BTB domain-containing protein n=1 Tax=Thanatephorus cucumeris (strain AG1-IB / isolate 7/3/14) TaxID=1108050 RepID=A0A0B7FIF9_THACB|nr:hypothetical protein RSOLAG1IB_02022 [Rhizoctonia solani AG-1 IB]
MTTANEGFTSGGDLTIRSSDGVEFNVHSLMLSLASPIFSDQLSRSNRAEAIQIPETAEILSLVLKFIYPLPTPVIPSLELLFDAMRVADKYELNSMKVRLREQLALADSPVSAYTNPLGALCVATAHGFTSEAELAAKVTSRRYDFATVGDLMRLVDAGPATSALVKLVGIPAVKTRVLAEVLFHFEHAPMHIDNYNIESLICAPCRGAYRSCARQGAPEWQTRWARWIFDRTKDSPISTWEKLFDHSMIGTAFYQPHLAVNFYAYKNGEHFRDCTCFTLILGTPSPFRAWATGVYEHLKTKLEVLADLEAQIYEAGLQR